VCSRIKLLRRRSRKSKVACKKSEGNGRLKRPRGPPLLKLRRRGVAANHARCSSSP
jgi:hypothetical protein